MRVFLETGPLLPSWYIDGASSELWRAFFTPMHWFRIGILGSTLKLHFNLRLTAGSAHQLPRLRHFRCIREIIEDSGDLSLGYVFPSVEPGLSVTHDVSISNRPARFFCLSRQIGQLGCRLARTSCPRHRSHLHLCSNLVGARVRTLPIDSSANCLFRNICL